MDTSEDATFVHATLGNAKIGDHQDSPCLPLWKFGILTAGYGREVAVHESCCDMSCRSM
jgi:hypothetical protein